MSRCPRVTERIGWCCTYADLFPLSNSAVRLELFEGGQVHLDAAHAPHQLDQ